MVVAHRGDSEPDLFDYQLNQRLTAESVELFSYGKQFSSKNVSSRSLTSRCDPASYTRLARAP